MSRVTNFVNAILGKRENAPIIGWANIPFVQFYAMWNNTNITPKTTPQRTSDERARNRCDSCTSQRLLDSPVRGLLVTAPIVIRPIQAMIGRHVGPIEVCNLDTVRVSDICRFYVVCKFMTIFRKMPLECGKNTGYPPNTVRIKLVSVNLQQLSPSLYRTPRATTS